MKSKHYVLSFSGGKDSTALLYLLVKNKYPLTAVVCNKMPFEEPDMYEHLVKMDNWLYAQIGLRITFVTETKPIEQFMSDTTKRGKHKGIIRGFPLKVSGFCWISRDWKIVPLEKWQRDYSKKHNCVVYLYLGFATDEKNRLRQQKINEYNENRVTYQQFYKESYPLVDFNYTEKDCLALLKEQQLVCDTHINYNRSGCWFCQKASVEARLFAIKQQPDRIKLIREWTKLSEREIYPDLTLAEIENYLSEV